MKTGFLESRECKEKLGFVCYKSTKTFKQIEENNTAFKVIFWLMVVIITIAICAGCCGKCERIDDTSIAPIIYKKKQEKHRDYVEVDRIR